MTFIRNLYNRYCGLSIVAKASLCYLLINIVQKGLNFITSPIYTRILSPSEFGEVSIYFSMEQLLGTVAMFCLSAGCFDVGMQDYKEDRPQFTFSVLVLSNIITLFSGSLLCLTYPYVRTYIDVKPTLLIVMFISFFLQQGFTLWTREKQYEYKYVIPGIVNVAGAIISSISAIMFIYLNPFHRAEARIIGAFIPMAIIYIFYWIYVAFRAKFKIKVNYLKFVFTFNLPLIPHYLSLHVLNSSDRIMIAHLVGNEQAAFYSLACSVAIIISTIWSAINTAIGPYTFDKYEKKKYKDVSDKILPILTVFAMICMFVILVAPEVIRILGTRDYIEAIYVIPSVVGGAFFQALYYVFADILYYYKKPQVVAIASISTGVLNVVLNYLCIPRFGYIAAGYTTLVCYLVQALLDYYVARKVVGVKIFNMKYLSRLMIVVLVISLLSGFLYQSLIVRIVVLLLISAAALKYRKKIIALFKQVLC